MLDRLPLELAHYILLSYVKDTVILDRLAPNQPYVEKTLVHLEVFYYYFLQSSSVAAYSSRRIMLPKGFERSVSPLEISLRLSTANSQRFTTEQPQPSMGVEMP